MIRRFTAAFFGLLFVSTSQAFNPTAVVVTPTTFDFGWCPDNAKIDAQFNVRNTGTDLVPLTGVQSTCGCTATDFNPGTLGSNEESKVLLTFNTRGYNGTAFHKNAKIKTDEGGTEYTVNLMGHVANPNSPVVPEGTGIVGFEPGAKDKKVTISIKNRGAKDVTLKVVQAAAGWATVKFDAQSLKAGESAPMVVSAAGDFKEDRGTSITVEANDGTTTSRFTVAIRTGTPPPSPRMPAKTTAPKAPAKK